MCGELVAADGTRFTGYLSPHAEPHVGYVQPTIVLGDRHVAFWSGLRQPTAESIANAYATLAKTADELFPLRYRALVPCRGADPAGALDGLLHYAPGGTDRVVSTR